MKAPAWLLTTWHGGNRGGTETDRPGRVLATTAAVAAFSHPARVRQHADGSIEAEFYNDSLIRETAPGRWSQVPNPDPAWVPFAPGSRTGAALFAQALAGQIDHNEGSRMIAALYVDARGCYVGVPGVDPWPADRDARRYRGPHRVIAHPPCERWGRFAATAFGRPCGTVGDDGWCFSAALAAVRAFGGVLEHPAGSFAWTAFDLAFPPRAGGWVRADAFGGWTCCVEQGHYGHRAPKPTWLYAIGCELPDLRWGPSGAKGRVVRPLAERSGGDKTTFVIAKRERFATPHPFRDVLLSIARTPGNGPPSALDLFGHVGARDASSAIASPTCVCTHCERPFTARRSHASHCSKRCRQAAYRAVAGRRRVASSGGDASRPGATQELFG
jgi:hypothetical protein